MSQQTNVPSEQQLVAVSSPVLETAQSLVIDSPIMFEMAGEELKTIKQKTKQLEDQRKAITQPMDKAKKEVMDLFRKPLEMLEQAEAVLKRSILAYTQEQRRIQQEAQRKADEAAAAERRRIEEEAKAAEKTGDVETAAVMQSAASMVVAAPVKTEAPKVAGVSTTTRWTAEVTDKVEYIKHVLAHPELIDTITIDMRPLNQMAVALKDKLSIPGIRPIANESVSARS
jgi:hypothetical protein